MKVHTQDSLFCGAATRLEGAGEGPKRGRVAGSEPSGRQDREGLKQDGEGPEQDGDGPSGAERGP